MLCKGKVQKEILVEKSEKAWIKRGILYIVQNGKLEVKI